MDVPRPEYPRPQFVRDAWLNLNGAWQFEIDRSDTGLERGLATRELAGTIVVPFCPESELSGPVAVRCAIVAAAVRPWSRPRQHGLSGRDGRDRGLTRLSLPRLPWGDPPVAAAI
ncbi:hypothetical protein GCM10010270_57900 [Streptomyces violaceus]|nr:hypothetical protein GCM10010270_57900 [Streptomyces janthinus]